MIWPHVVGHIINDDDDDDDDDDERACSSAALRLRNALPTDFKRAPQYLTDRSILSSLSFIKRLRACIKVNGEHYEQQM